MLIQKRIWNLLENIFIFKGRDEMKYYIYESRIFQKYREVGDRIRKRLSKIILKLFPNVKPKEITILSFFIGVLASISFGLSHLVFGALLYYLSDVFDGIDGYIARYKKLSSSYGAYLDSCLDRYVDAFVIIGVILHLLTTFPNIKPLLIIGILALVGIFMHSYSTHRAEALEKTILQTQIPFDRRMRMHLIVFGSIFNQLFYILLILAIVSNLNILWKLHPSMMKDFKKLGEKQIKLLPKTSIKKFRKR